MFLLAKKREGQILIVTITEAKVMYPNKIEKLRLEFLSILKEKGVSSVAVNFKDVSFFSSAAIGHLNIFRKKALAQGVSLKLCDLRPDVSDLFSYTSLDQLFSIAETEANAVLALS